MTVAQTVEVSEIVRVDLDNLPYWATVIMNAVRPMRQCPIAGSFALWLWLSAWGKEPSWQPSDIDIFMKFSSDKGKVIYDIFRHLSVQSRLKETQVISTIKMKNFPNIQIISRKSAYSCPTDFIQDFDLSVASIAITNIDGEDVEFVFVDDEVKHDIEKGECRVFRTFETVNVSRLVKYQQRGFKLKNGNPKPNTFCVEYC